MCAYKHVYTHMVHSRMRPSPILRGVSIRALRGPLAVGGHSLPHRCTQSAERDALSNLDSKGWAAKTDGTNPSGLVRRICFVCFLRAPLSAAAVDGVPVGHSNIRSSNFRGFTGDMVTGIVHRQQRHCESGLVQSHRALRHRTGQDDSMQNRWALSRSHSAATV